MKMEVVVLDNCNKQVGFLLTLLARVIFKDLQESFKNSQMNY